MSGLEAALLDLHPPEGQGSRAPLRLTDGGIWHATPVGVLAAAVPRLAGLLADLGLPGSGCPLRVLDAGAGDGRLLSALALGLPAELPVLLFGLEIDAALAAVARERASRLVLGQGSEDRRPCVDQGDFLEVSSYARLGMKPAELDLVFNYPDGNERRLLAWLRGHGGPRTHLLILSPDHDPALGVPPRARIHVPSGQTGGATWSLTAYATGPERAVIASRPSGRVR